MQKIVRYFLMSIIFSTSLDSSPEFLYPVAVSFPCNQKNPVIYLVCQETNKKLSLLEWNPRTRNYSSVLISTYTPTGYSFFPDYTGFSFIDNGIIHIKFNMMRSPKVLRIYEPIYDFGSITWIDNFHGYFHAQYHKYYGIYQVTIHGDLTCILSIPHSDCLYPQKINSNLFYIERTKRGGISQYCISIIPYPEIIVDDGYTFNNTEQFEAIVDRLLSDGSSRCRSVANVEQRQIILSFKERPITFLYMTSEYEGFFLEHPSKIDSKSKTIPFSYYQIKKQGGKWFYTKLFSFSIPTELLLFKEGDNYLCESLLPLLPRHINDGIYFVDCVSPHNMLSIFYYSLTYRLSECLLSSSDYHFFAPIAYCNTIFCGGTKVSFLVDGRLDLEVLR
jgi:hypothetical protein